MFAGVKQGSFRRELSVELGLRAHVDGAVVDAAIDHNAPLELAQAQLGILCQDLDHHLRVGPVAVGHGQAV